MGKGVTDALFFDVLEPRKFRLPVKDEATGTPHVRCICTLLAGCLRASVHGVAVYIGVGLSALLVPTGRGNARALIRGTGNWFGLTSLFYRCGTIGKRSINPLVRRGRGKTKKHSNMKRIFYLLFLSFLLLPQAASAYDFESDGILYYIIASSGEKECGVDGSSFANYSRDVTIPDSVEYNGTVYAVTAIGSNAFAHDRLTSITIPKTVTDIGAWAFEGCSGLTSITIPDGVTTIGQSAFLDCSGLTSVTLSSSVTSVDYWNAFAGCTNLISIDVDEKNECYSSMDGLILDKSGSTLIHVPGGITSVTIPSSVTSVNTNAFHGCTNLISIDVDEKNECYSSMDGSLLDKSGSTLIRVPIGVTSVSIPDGVTSIGAEAFYGCSGLTSITIPDGVTSIGQHAFRGCI